MSLGLPQHYSHLTDDEIKAQKHMLPQPAWASRGMAVQSLPAGSQCPRVLRPNEPFPVEVRCTANSYITFQEGRGMKGRDDLSQAVLEHLVWIMSDQIVPRPWKGQRLRTPNLHNQCKTPGYLCSPPHSLAISRLQSRPTILLFV